VKFDLWKIAVTGLWILIGVNLFADFPQVVRTSLNALGTFLVVSHLGEYYFCRKTIDARPEGTLLAFVMTFFYGVFYWRDYPTKAWDES
jgi:uncharacterized protein YhhL (DUF1145 family)